LKTYVPKEGEIAKKWVVIDAEDKILGRVAAEAARLLRGKHKPQYTPYLDCGDHVIVINASKARLSGNKHWQKMYYRHSQYPGGLKASSYAELIVKHPTRAMEQAIKGMLPSNRLGRKMATNVRVYADADHPHTAQNPEVHEF